MSELNPDKPSRYAEAMKAFWAVTDALMGGTRKMREMGQELLPRHEAESDTAYANRLKASTLLNVFRSTVRQMTGQAFAKPVELGEGAPAQLTEWSEDIDLEGRSLSQYLRIVFASLMQKSDGYILVSMDRAGEDERTAADERRAGRRPYWVFIPANNMLKVVTERVGQREIVTKARWKDVSIEEGEDFNEVVVTRVHEWSAEGFTTWKRDGTESWAVEEEGENAFSIDGVPAVPLVPIHLTEEEEDGLRVPPLMDLADKNVEHWQSASDQRNILTYGRFPMWGASGVDEEDLPKNSDGKVVLGPGTFLYSSDAQAKFYAVEPQGNAINAGAEDLKRIVEEMAVLAAQPYITRPGNITATRSSLEEGKASSVLDAYVETLRDGAELAIIYTGAWVGQAWSVGIKIEPQFGIAQADAAKVNALIAARARGDLSRDAMLEEFRAMGILSDVFDAEANAAQLEAELGRTLEDEEDDDDDPAAA